MRYRTMALPALPLLVAATLGLPGPVIVLGAKLAEIGARGGAPEQEFGVIEDISADSRGNVYVLDSELNQVRVFDAQGRFLAQAGGAGSGPGELAAPRAVALDVENGLHVFDAATRRISQYRMDGTALKLVRSIPIDVAGSDMCMLGRRYYVFGLNDGAIIHEIAHDGRRLKSFGRPFGGEQPILQRSLANGHITCVPEENLVLVIPAHTAELRAYSVGGRLKWITRLDAYRQVTIRENSAGSITYTTPAGGYHQATSLFAVSPRVAVVQLGLRTNETRLRDRFAGVDTRLLSLTDGKELAAQNDLPRLARGNQRLLVALASDPAPRATLFRFQLQQKP